MSMAALVKCMKHEISVDDLIILGLLMSMVFLTEVFETFDNYQG
jgi:hypothetical protein